MKKIRILKLYKSSSPKAGIEEADYVELKNASDAAEFVSKINATERLDYEIIDWDVAMITSMDAPEIVKNPTGGGTGKLILPN